MGNIHVKYRNLDQRFISRALAAPLFSGLEPFKQYLKKASRGTTL